MVALVTVLVVGLLAWALLREPTRSADVTGGPETTGRTDESGAGTELVFRLEQALRGRRAAGDDVVAEGDRQARREVRDLRANVRALRITGLSLRYVDEAGLELTPELRERYGEDAWVGEVQLSWRTGAGLGAAFVEVPVVLDWAGDTAVLATTRHVGGYRVPLWFLDRVHVRGSDEMWAVATSRARAGRLERMGQEAVEVVRRRLDLSLPLVVEWPANRQQFETVSDVRGQEAGVIAAVTTTADGSNLVSSPVHVFLNPAVFDPLGPDGRQIVVSHEAAHVALGATAGEVPLWLSEGTADYVALADSDVPTSVLAAQARRLVRQDGPPRRLPGPEEFSGDNADIGAHYEMAWLAAETIADRYGEENLFALHRAMERRADARTVQDVLGVTESALVRQWRARLRDLAAGTR